MTKKIILSTFTDPKINQVLKDNLFFLAPAHQLDGQNNYAFNLGRYSCLKNNCESINTLQRLYSNDYERLLARFCSALNEFHKTANETKYWESIIGSWFFRFFQTVHNRKNHLENAIKEFNFKDLTLLVPKRNQDTLGVLTENQIVKNLSDPYWNACLYQLISNVYKTNIEEIFLDKSPEYKPVSKKINWLSLYSKLALKFNFNDVVYYKPYVPKNSLFNFILNAKRLPIYGPRAPENIKVKQDLVKRMKAFNALPFSSKEDRLFLEVLIKIAPTIFFEDFSSFKEKSLNFFQVLIRKLSTQLMVLRATFVFSYGWQRSKEWC